MHYRRGLQPDLAVKIAKNRLKITKKSLPDPPANQPTPPRRRAVCIRAQGLFAHAAARGVPTIAVTQAKAAHYKNICASEPENVCTLLAAVPATLACGRPTHQAVTGAHHAAMWPSRPPVRQPASPASRLSAFPMPRHARSTRLRIAAGSGSAAQIFEPAGRVSALTRA